MNQFYTQSLFFNNDWFSVLFIVLSIWTLFWKGYSLWTASKNNQWKWFIALLLLNTVGILDIIYIFHVAKKNWSDVKGLFKRDEIVK